MAASPPPRRRRAPRRSGDPAFEASAFDDTLEPAATALALAGLAPPRAGAGGAAGLRRRLLRWRAGVAATPFVDARWSVGARRRARAREQPAAGAAGRTAAAALVAVGAPAAPPCRWTPLLLHRSPRWQVDDAERARQVAAARRPGARCSPPARCTLHFADGSAWPARRPRRAAGPGWAGCSGRWPRLALAAAADRRGRAAGAAAAGATCSYAVMALCQAGNLLFIALETTRGLGLPPGVRGARTCWCAWRWTAPPAPPP